MKRETMIGEIENSSNHWDIIIIGGGATGLGAAVDSALRGYKTLLLEQSDFSKGTSSRSTKLIHGGLRYLQQGNLSLVAEALKERGHLCENAPHLVHHLPFLVPHYQWWESPFYGIGLKLYDLLAGKLGIEKSRSLSRKEALETFPTLEPTGLRGGSIYYDGQFDDSRLAICLAQTAAHLGATLINYFKVTQLIKKKGTCIGVQAIDQESGCKYQLHGKIIINATGIFSDSLLQQDNPQAKPIIALSQGTHIVLNNTLQANKTAILIPRTRDKRVLFLIPWHDRILLGTTDIAVQQTKLEPIPSKQEIDFLLEQAEKYLSKNLSDLSILSVFAGLRPLVKEQEKKNTAVLSREHKIFISNSKLITIAGGKWTTYRKMAEDVIDQAMRLGKLPLRECTSSSLKLYGWEKGLDPRDHFSTYGSFRKQVKALAKENPSYSSLLHPKLPYTIAEVIWAVRSEMARSVEDVLARRTRSLLLDAAISSLIAPQIAKLLAIELNKDQDWEKKQVEEYKELCKGYQWNYTEIT